MKITLIGLLSFICLAFAGCSNDEDNTFNLSQTDFKDVSYEGGELSVDLDSYNGWISKSDADWCTVSQTTGNGGKTTLKINVEGNVEAERTATITIKTQKDTRTIKVSQQGLPEGTVFTYKLPIVFHVIYKDANNQQQNVPQQRLYEMLDTINKLYKNAGFQSENMNVEFVAATVDPQGNKMSEPGIDRIQYPTSTLDMEDVMFGEKRKYNQFLWDPNKYVNVMIYTFTSKNSNTLGVAHFPYSPQDFPLNGTDTTPYDYISVDNLPFAYCVSLNNSFIKKGTSTDTFGKLNDLQMELGHTLAHELGHYLGLRHTFSEASDEYSCLDTDYCEDTPSYNYQEYTYQITKFSEGWKNGSIPNTLENFLTLFNRSNCNGQAFVSHNIMDYEFCYSNQFTKDQLARVRHVLTYSPLIPGPKKRLSTRSRSVAPKGVLNLPIKASVCPPVRNISLK